MGHEAEHLGIQQQNPLSTPSSTDIENQVCSGGDPDPASTKQGADDEGYSSTEDSFDSRHVDEKSEMLPTPDAPKEAQNEQSKQVKEDSAQSDENTSEADDVEISSRFTGAVLDLPMRKKRNSIPTRATDRSLSTRSSVSFKIPKEPEGKNPTDCYDLESNSGLEKPIPSTPKKIGGKYSQHEFTFVLMAGVLLSFNSGYVNGSCLSGLLTIHGVTHSVAGFTGAYTKSALALAEGDAEYFGFEVSMILSFIFGACISGMMTPDATPYRIEPTYGPTFMIGAVLLAIASVLAAFDDEQYFFYFAAAASGVQNGMSSIYSANLIRSTHLTGTSTDIGLFIGQLIRGNRKNLWKLLVLISLAAAFWLGGFVSFYATTHFTHFSLLFNAALFMLIGISLIYFLVVELKVTVAAAMTGTWMWQKVFDRLEESMRETVANGMDLRKSQLYTSQHFAAYFDVLEGVDENGEIEDHDLHGALEKAGVGLSKDEVKILIRHADEDGNGKLSKEEWVKIGKSATKGKSSATNS